MANKHLITASQLREQVTYNPDTGLFTRNKAHPPLQAGAACHMNTKSGYAFIQVCGKRYAAHRLAFLYMTGDWPELYVDHINGDPLDNRWVNLRDVDNRTNAENKRKPTKQKKSGLPLGVYRNTNIVGKWGKLYRAEITVAGKVTVLGRFNCPEEAHLAYLEGKRRLHAGCTI